MPRPVAAVGLATACVLAIVVVVDRSDRVVLTALPPTDPPLNAVGHYRCDVKCETAWTEHLKAVQAKLAAEHKKPAAPPTLPPRAREATVAGPSQALPRSAVWPHVQKAQRSGLAAVRAKTPPAVHARPTRSAVWPHVQKTQRSGLAAVRARPPHAVHARPTPAVRQTKRKSVLRVVPRVRRAATAHKSIDKLKFAEAILGAGNTRKRMSLRGAAVKWGASHPVGTENKMPAQLSHSPHPIFARRPTPTFWHHLLHVRHTEPWKQGRQLRQKEIEHESRRARPVDHTLDYLHVPADRADPVKTELTKLGLVQNKHSFASMQKPVDHTLDYLHVPADSSDPVLEAASQLPGSKDPLKDHALDFMRVPSNDRKVDMEAVDTVKAFEQYEPNRGDRQRKLQKLEREEEQERERASARASDTE